MMINVTGDYSVKESESKYPYIGIDQYRQIVLFTEEGKGVLLDNGKSGNSTGTYAGWFEKAFSPIEGTITISNK
jgi:hypothetical protein